MSYLVGKNIIATVTYYDVMDFPLTLFEIWKYLLEHDRDGNHLDRPVSLGEVWDVLESDQCARRIEKKNGFYFLPGREALVQQRIQSEKLSVEKLKGMKRLAWVLQYVPYVRMIGATGSLAMKHGVTGSDWDMFVVLRSGRIWMGRTVLTGFLHLIGKRRHGKKISNRACLNYFVTDDSLEIATKDLYSAHEYRHLIPLLSFPLFQIFELKNRWIKNYQPNFSLSVLPNRWLVAEDRSVRRIRNFFERLLDRLQLEKWLGSWQKKKIARNPKTQLEGSLIEATDRSLVFLPRPRGPLVFEKFKERLSM
ncbi:MAG: hypothetical protein KBD27_02380 [Candidatus Moranbacteria bacterium]|nr:hypothetical protein [Candidatus Moranbacteria bacterium]